MSTREFLHLPTAQIRQILDAAVRAGLAQSRPALLGGIDLMFISSFHRAHNASAQLLLDLNVMNGVEALSDGSVPLFDWLSNATLLAGPRAEADVFRVALDAVKIKAGVASTPIPARSSSGGGQTLQSTRFQDRGLLALDVEAFWVDPRGSALHKVLKVAYGDLANVRRIAAIAGVAMSDVSVAGGVGDIWFDLLSVAIRGAIIERLVDAVLKDDAVAFYHPQILRLRA